MTPDEVLDLLTLIAVRDNRTVGRTTAVVWHEDIGDLDFADCREAVARHYRESTDWLMPATIHRLVKAIRAERLEGFRYVPTPGHTDYLADLRAQIAAVGNGRREAVPALPAGPDRSEERDALLAELFPQPAVAAPDLPGAETPAETRTRLLTEAYGYLITIDDDARTRAIDAAREQIGGGAPRQEVVLLAARIADARPLPPPKPDKATADLLAAHGCPNGCPLGKHVKPCFYTEA